jgi:hypothetical protein
MKSFSKPINPTRSLCEKCHKNAIVPNTCNKCKSCLNFILLWDRALELSGREKVRKGTPEYDIVIKHFKELISQGYIQKLEKEIEKEMIEYKK